ncbi:hypothetical protein [Mangrovicoccus algicola]|uniref:Uncharacterized protein n=1 Tax=Mangrovicoccus algicola TaxID=2771008 RepID=A0A8J6YVQ3_9RHOB|nr:hypothetical protein [Mangrovicoccus algicola]MBE3636636.1 hypothetical protein [Mangrovicoccus algicola]
MWPPLFATGPGSVPQAAIRFPGVRGKRRGFDQRPQNAAAKMGLLRKKTASGPILRYLSTKLDFSGLPYIQKFEENAPLHMFSFELVTALPYTKPHMVNAVGPEIWGQSEKHGLDCE